jgi:hypothetical protein
MAPRGKTPSLIGSGAGSSKIVTALGKRTCKRCHAPIPKASKCIEVGVPGSFGSKTYCKECYSNILEQSKADLAKLESAVSQM